MGGGGGRGTKTTFFNNRPSTAKCLEIVRKPVLPKCTGWGAIEYPLNPRGVQNKMVP